MNEPYSPKELLRSRRPGRFSDSDVQIETKLDRSILETHLLTLTARGQETAFEAFAKRLCEAEVCPNLVPHTGPDAGGDAKVDTQTFPVADALADAWYVGVGRDGDTDAARERWAFAVSTQKTWRAKVRADVAKIVATDRGFTKAFFVSNQYISDKDKATVEDALAAEHGIEVRIFDLSWILDRVFEHGREAIAIETLGITGLSRSTAQTGPLDAQRKAELDEIEARIHEATQGTGFTRATVDDMIRAAVLARELEHPAVAVEGRFGRAKRIARKFGTARQRVEAAYLWAWTLYYYHEDFLAFSEAYSEVEVLALGTRNARDLEQLSTLWSCLFGAAVGEFLDDATAQIEARAQTLLDDFDRLATEKDRPSTALQARALALNVRIMQRLHRGENADDLLHDVAGVIREAEPLLGFPVDPVVRIYTELAPFFEGSAAYDHLFDILVEIDARRKGDVQAATRLLDRGKQQLVNGYLTEALVSASRALHKLTKEEARLTFALALYVGGQALDGLGLPWAARGFFLGAASATVDEKWHLGKVTPAQATSYRRMKWTELRLGRIPHLLAWHSADLDAREYLVGLGENPEEMAALHREFDHQTAQLFLRLNAEQLDALRSLPDVLHSLDLQLARIALLFALGHTKLMDVLAQAEDGNLSAEDLAGRLAHLRPHDWSAVPHLYTGAHPVTFTSRVLGCEIRITSDSAPQCINVSEALLGTIEGFLATTLGKVIAWESRLTVDVRPDDQPLSEDSPPFTVEFEEREGRPHLDVRCCTFDPNALSIPHQFALRNATFELAVQACSQFVQFRDMENDLEALFRDERAFDRAIGFTGVYGAYVNVLGSDPQTTLGYWLHPDAESYDLLRSEPWQPPPDPPQEHLPEDAKDLSGLDGQGHQHVGTITFVRARLWDRAAWRSTQYLMTPEGDYPPGIALIFEDQDAGREIFRHWRDRLGEGDEQDQLRIAIIRGVDRSEPHTYRVTIGTDLDAFPMVSAGAPRFVNTPVRIRTESVLASEVLDRFIETYERLGTYFLVSATPDAEGQLDIGWDLRLLKRKLFVRSAWEIGPKDLDSVAILDDDDPVIPRGVDDPPVFRLLGQRNDRSA